MKLNHCISVTYKQSYKLLSTIAFTVIDNRIHCYRQSYSLLSTIVFTVIDNRIHCYRQSYSLLSTIVFTVIDNRIHCYLQSYSLLSTITINNRIQCYFIEESYPVNTIHHAIERCIRPDLQPFAYLDCGLMRVGAL